MHCTSDLPRDGEPFKVLVIGGSYAGLSATLNLLDLCHGKPCRFTPTAESPSSAQIPVQITIVDERDGFYHLIGSPLAFASEEYATKAWVKFEDIPALQTPEIRWVQGRVTEVDCGRKRCTIQETGARNFIEEHYDYLVAASGLRRTWPSAPRSLSRKAYLAEATKHISQAKHARSGVVVIGGGAVGIEMAAELKLARPEQKVTLIHSRDRLLSSEPLPDSMKDRALSALQSAGVETILRSRVTLISPDDGRSSLTLSGGRRIQTSHVIDAVSRSSPTTSYLPAGAVDSEGYVKVDSRLNFAGEILNSQDHFAAGDLALWSGIKRAGGAMHQGHYAAINIHQRMLSQRTGSAPQFAEIQKMAPVICLAIGRTAVGYNDYEGVIEGEDMLQLYFRDDLGFGICWDYMRLGDAAKA